MRVQLSSRRLAEVLDGRRVRFLGLGLFLGVLLFASVGRAQVAEFDTTHTLFLEAPTKSKMTVYSPAAGLEVTPWDFLTVRGGWEADVVSGASIKVKAGPAYAATHPGADVVTAASVHDFRNSAHGGFTLRKDTVQVTGGYAYSTENDYKSNAFNVAARTDAYEHDTQFEIAYAHNFDRVCDRVQSVNDPAPRFRALEDSVACFANTNPLRTTLPINVDSLQGSWSQAWTPTFQTQLIYTAQITSGFQSNPYRSVILAEGVETQEHEPDNRARQAVAGRANFYIRPLRAALRLSIRGYRDTWAIQSGTGEAEFEKYFGEAFRVTLRGRYYKQSGALFWSDDYTGGNPPLGPKGQYWTGDRELSPFSSWLVGLRAFYTFTPASGRLLGIMSSFKVGVVGDVINFSYDEFTLAGQPVENARAWVAGLTISAVF
jgi:hypothetical protein